ncbi:head-tail adaptor protein [Luteolibacter sp. GHJ8]|uniref:Head-tail adaptor protein n=1 Tax=Luteolibacter rhizosphaerae TaxID=2989719 RepID=A0ABT3G829_9BACT|nr:head-tail adaptor protein [Luteolibacter rhizosphaerae]MCW1916000.1 head-tail adaptor protein [Luteolibacter rhizosphaerae]
MNPGLLRHPIRIERPVTTVDELGQPVPGWERVGVCFARRMKERAGAETVRSDRPVEQRRAVFRVRSQPFLRRYREGDRLVELARGEMPEVVWEIEGWAEVDGTNGSFVEVLVLLMSFH